MAGITVSYTTTLALIGNTSSVQNGKRKAPLQQTDLLAALDGGIQKGKKRAITLANGGEEVFEEENAYEAVNDALLDELDLASALPVTAQVLEAMRLRIIELEDELYKQPPLKRARISSAVPVAMASTSTSGPTPASIKADEKKRKMQVKKIFDRLKKECKADGVKFQGLPKTIKFDELYEQPEFEALFSGKGLLIQPTPENKPKSAVTIIHFNTPAEVNIFFGDELKALKGNKWTRGGIPVRAFGAGFGGLGSTFAKSVKVGAVDISVRSLEVNYSKNNMKCILKFEVAQDQYDAYDSDY